MESYSHPAPCSHRQTYIDVVFGPVDAADCPVQTTQAALAHVTGDGAAEAREAEKAVAYCINKKNTTSTSYLQMS